jgi:flagellar hook-associated protein 2
MASIISSLGAGSGIDMATLTTQLVEAQFSAKIARLDQRDEQLDAQISAASSMKNKIQSLATALGDRVRTGDLTPLPTIANAAVATVSRVSIAAPKSGSYSLEVLALARSQSLASTPYASAASTVGSGTLTLRFGTVDGATFAANAARDPVAITIPAGATLQDVASAINSSGSGVSAYVAATTTGAKLVMKGADGAENGFTLEATETVDDEGLAALAWSPGGASSAQILSNAGDALYRLDGLEMSSKSNTVTTAIDGLSFSLTGTNIGSPTRIGFSNPAPNITTALTDFVSALNEIQAEMATAMDAQNGDIRRDNGAQALRRELSALTSRIIMPNAGAGEPATLAQLGVKTNRDGSYALDTSILSKALTADPEAVAAMFTPGLYGIYAEMDRISRGTSSVSNPGSLAASIQRYSSMKTNLVEDRTDLNEASEKLRARLSKQFTVADTRVAGFKSTLTFLENQVAAWNKSD